MKNALTCRIMLLTMVAFLCVATTAFAKVEWEILQNVTLDDTPRDVAVTGDGATAYILCDKSVKIFTRQGNKITGSIPLEDDFTQIAISPDGNQLYLTKSAGKQLSIIQISQIYDIPIGESPVIGKAGAPVTVFAFLDYQ